MLKCVKISRTDIGKVNLLGEYTTITAMKAVSPELVPTPIGIGTYETDSDVHFYLASFVDMTDEVPDVDQLPIKMAELHSRAVSEKGYGFDVPTNMGACTQANAWTVSWESAFATLLDRMFHFEQEMHGINDDMQTMHQTIMSKVIPRLLRPLETGENSIQPRLVHGDLWDGNTSVNATTDDPIIFDASGMYAHNECKSTCIGLSTFTTH